MKLKYHETVKVNFSTENFQNAGLTPAKIKEVIESVTGAYTCSPTGINHNWSVTTRNGLPLKTHVDIEYRLNKAVKEL